MLTHSYLLNQIAIGQYVWFLFRVLNDLQISFPDDDTEEATEDQSSESNSDMILKEETSEPELFEAEDLLVNPDDLLPPVVKLEKYANSDIVFNR